ncbi:MAG: cytochrome c oxidase subunit II [Alphaproteobacteria bacterium]|nr:cytochrome c oxidase subunit II [Alphaproteobacteria bacterium]
MSFYQRLALLLCGLVTAGTFGFSGSAAADPPVAWQWDLNKPATDLMREIVSFHNALLIVITLISLFVLVLLVYVFIKFNAKANPKASKTTHNTVIEVLWTVIPVVILVAITASSFRLLYHQDVVPKQTDMTIKAIGKQWYWSYEYPDHGNFTFDALMVPDKELKPGQPRLLQTDNVVVVPVNATVKVLITAADVIHAWTVPSFGVKADAVPGRTQERWFKADREGTFYGQCSELCGVNHGFMPITVEVVSKQKFDAWVTEARRKFARDDQAPPRQVAEIAQPSN